MDFFNQDHNRACSICYSTWHTIETCPTYYYEQANARNNFEGPFGHSSQETYNPNMGNHFNYSYTQNQFPTHIDGQPLHSHDDQFFSEF